MELTKSLGRAKKNSLPNLIILFSNESYVLIKLNDILKKLHINFPTDCSLREFSIVLQYLLMLYYSESAKQFIFLEFVYRLNYKHLAHKFHFLYQITNGLRYVIKLILLGTNVA